MIELSKPLESGLVNVTIHQILWAQKLPGSKSAQLWASAEFDTETGIVLICFHKATVPFAGIPILRPIGSLPMTSHGLREAWERRDRTRLYNELFNLVKSGRSILQVSIMDAFDA
jgi:hypothetical protein